MAAEVDDAGASYMLPFNEWLISIEDSSVGNIRIPRVPESLRSIESNRKCFDPVVVSLGPYHHHSRPHLRRMEPYKLAALSRFTDSSDRLDAERYFNALEDKIYQVKELYEEVAITNEEFARVMFMDTCFVLDFINEVVGTPQLDGLHLSSQDRTLVARDMMLLENQLPLKLLIEFMSFKNNGGKPATAPGGKRRVRRHLEEVSRSVDISTSVNTENQQQEQQPLDIINVFIDHLIETHEYSAKQPSDPLKSPQEDQDPDEDVGEPIHLLDCFRRKILGKGRSQPKLQLSSNSLKSSNRKKWYSFRCITELKEAGIQVRRSETHHLKGVQFSSSLFCRELVLPAIVIDDTTKYKFLNMIAYEMGPGGPSTRGITSYACFMDSLIDSKEDVKELRSKDVLLNALGSDQEVADLFNAMTIDATPNPDAYAEVKDFIESNCKKWWRVSLVNLYYMHFSSPWTMIAFLAAVFLLFLTATQTYLTAFPQNQLISMI